MDEYSAALLAAVDVAVAPWIERSVCGLVSAYRGSCGDATKDAARQAGERARADVHRQLNELLATDVDAQRANPLDILRRSVRHATDVLRQEEVPEVVRDEFAERTFPDDVYGLVPAKWSDIDPALHEPGMAWGAWKAHQHLSRRRQQERGPRVAFFAPDLMDRSKLAAVRPEAEFVSVPGELRGAALAVVDLSRLASIEELAGLEVGRMIAFGPHVERDALDAARAAGVDLVLTRREFFGRLEELLSR